MTLMTGERRRVPLNTVVPYWRNPRRVTDQAVNAVASSLTEFGYQQPLVVDTDLCIIIGHTRYAAMRRLEMEEADILVVNHLSENQVKQLRVLDNRVSEFTRWNFEALSAELSDLDSSLLTALFPDVLLDAEGQAQADPRIDTRDFSGEWDKVETEVEFICPHCFHSWSTEVTRAQIIEGKIA